MVSRMLRTLAVAALATLTLLAGCANGAGNSGASTAAHGPTKLGPLCDDLTGAGPARQPTGSYPLPTTDADGVAIARPATTPHRIVTLTPTDTEIVAALGDESEIVGIDADSDYPADITSRPVVTDKSGFTVNDEKVIALKPDLILAFGGYFPQDDATFRRAGIDVVSLPVGDLRQAMVDILLVGQLTGTQTQAQTLVAKMEECISTIKTAVASQKPPSVYYEEDYSTPPKPYTVSQGSFENDLIVDAGGVNIFATITTSHNPQVNDEQVVAANPQVIFLTEPPQYLAQTPQKRPAYQGVSAVVNGRVYFLNPDVSSRPGPRIVMTLEQMARDLWPSLFS